VAALAEVAALLLLGVQPRASDHEEGNNG